MGGTWNNDERKLLKGLHKPMKVQEWLDSIDYDPDPESRSPRFVMKERRAHCFEGALFAAACLREMGHPPLLVDLRAENDDDHVIAVFREDGLWGAVAKSNFTSLRFREPVYRSLRELTMSYFDFYFNTNREKSLRSYSRPLDLTRFDDKDWMFTEGSLEYIGDELDRILHYPLISKGMVKKLSLASQSMLDAGLLGSKPEGLFKPKEQ
jgi:hypothetical protein